MGAGSGVCVHARARARGGDGGGGGSGLCNWIRILALQSKDPGGGMLNQPLHL